MRGQFVRNMLELFRAPCERLDSCRNNHAAGLPVFAIFGGETKAHAVFFYAFNLSGVAVRHGLGLKPAAVVDEATQRQRGSDGVSSRGLVALQREILIRVGEVGARQGRAKKHEFGHVFLPERHGLAKDRSEEHTSELQSHSDLVCRLLLEKKKQRTRRNTREAYGTATSPTEAKARRCRGGLR